MKTTKLKRKKKEKEKRGLDFVAGYQLPDHLQFTQLQDLAIDVIDQYSKHPHQKLITDKQKRKKKKEAEKNKLGIQAHLNFCERKHYIKTFQK